MGNHITVVDRTCVAHNTRNNGGSWQMLEVCACVHTVYSYTFWVMWEQFSAFTWNFSWMTSCIIKHEIHIMLKVFPNISIALEQSCGVRC